MHVAFAARRARWAVARTSVLVLHGAHHLELSPAAGAARAEDGEPLRRRTGPVAAGLHLRAAGWEGEITEALTQERGIEGERASDALAAVRHSVD